MKNLGGFDERAPDATGRYDDALALGVPPTTLQPESRILIDSKLSDGGHDVPERLLRARVRGWMQLNESIDEDFWIGSYTSDGRWVWCSSNADRYLPRSFRIDYAQNVCRHLNRTYPAGGVWLAGWIRGGRTFYLLWKDQSGDIQVPIEADKPFITLAKYPLEAWEKHAIAALGVWSEWRASLDMTPEQMKNVAEGEQVSRGHQSEGAKVAPYA